MLIRLSQPSGSYQPPTDAKDTRVVPNGDQITSHFLFSTAVPYYTRQASSKFRMKQKCDFEWEQRGKMLEYRPPPD